MTSARVTPLLLQESSYDISRSRTPTENICFALPGTPGASIHAKTFMHEQKLPFPNFRISTFFPHKKLPEKTSFC
jgi:hypothetical protein